VERVVPKTLQQVHHAQLPVCVALATMAAERGFPPHGAITIFTIFLQVHKPRQGAASCVANCLTFCISLIYVFWVSVPQMTACKILIF
jgi:hypothetical protein